MDDPAFSLANPNRVRALVGSFAMTTSPSSTAPTAQAMISWPMSCSRSTHQTRKSRRGS